jgi:hypothetical protein
MRSLPRRWGILEYANDGSTISVDQKAVATGTSATASSGNVTTLSASELLLGAGLVNNGQEFNPGASYTERFQVVGKMAHEDRVVSSTGTYDSSNTFGGSDDWIQGIITLKAVSAVPPAVVQILMGQACL